MPLDEEKRRLRALARRRALGHRVRELRAEREWTQEQLSERSGIHTTYISGIERGLRNVGLDNIGRLADVFEVSVSDLFADV